MAKPEIRIFRNLEELSREAARRFQELANQRLARKKIFTAALSGGSTPKRLYELLGDPKRKIPWDRVHLFEVDERCVPPNDPESNYRMIREALLERAPIPTANFHRLKAEIPNRDLASWQYAREMAAVIKPPPGEYPHLDLILLGMGDDGHTASLFPGSPALSERKLWVCPNFSHRLGKFRLTMTYPVLNAAAQVIFLVAGADKTETLDQVLNGPPSPQKFPAQGVQPENGKLAWFVDRAAAGNLAHGVRKRRDAHG